MGNLLGDGTVWQAGIFPRRPAEQLSASQLAHLHAALQQATRDATCDGGVDAGDSIGFRAAGARSRGAEPR